MDCPNCGMTTKVFNTGSTGQETYRQRCCPVCGLHFETVERISKNQKKTTNQVRYKHKKAKAYYASMRDVAAGAGGEKQ